ncbi:O-antigen ligase family protein [Actinoplanes sp. NBRC 103695]|uniref:O-antigen ligase family protein n=1 Tax=Actinoplanes sp. NBRC 103695 TaxID=3032202 RepID=UPI0024A17541|nr:O-antigen ligase family protein [Actinoplanes sp. NBRC 103695]GLY99116.1 putative bicarbonate transporter, IctB family protein [Actinoplanes sp. NBRC 103695]
MRSRLLTGGVALVSAAAAGFTAWALGEGSLGLAALPVAAVLGLVVAALALTRFGVYVLLMLAIRPMVDLFKLSGPTAGKAGVDAEGVSRTLDPSTILAVLFLIAAGLWLAARAHRDGRLRTSPLGAALLMVGATGLVSALGADRPENSFLEALRILTVVVMFVVLEQLVPDQRYARRVLLAVYASLAVVIAYTVILSLTGNPPAEVKGTFVRISGPFAQSTTFGRYLMFLLIFGFGIFRYVHGRLRVSLGVLLGLSFVCLMLTNTRSAILGLAIGLIVVALVQRSAGMLLALGLAAVLGVALLPAVGDRFAQLADARQVGGAPTGNTLAWRLDYWSEIVPLADRNPVTGIGPNMTQFQTDEAKKPHNDFLRAYVETGAVGLLAYLAMITLLLLAGLRALRRAPPGTLARGIAAGYLGCAVAFLAISAVSNVLSSVATLWYLVAFAAVAGAIKAQSGASVAPTVRLEQVEEHGDSGLSRHGA